MRRIRVTAGHSAGTGRTGEIAPDDPGHHAQDGDSDVEGVGPHETRACLKEERNCRLVHF